MTEFKNIQDKWQKRWAESKVFKVYETKGKKKFYCLEMFPYPSASFLHMGHVRNYSIGDSIARFKRLQGYNVLYPMGYDSFGLPAENAAKKEKIHPRIYTEKAIAKITEYFKELGLSYDWDRMIATHEPTYYKWNQYFFIKFFEKGLVYRKKAKVNFCPNCNTVLANEEVEKGECWRCHNQVIDKDLDQWFFKTTAYSDQLLDDLKKLDWSEKIKTIQENWIGKSHGVNINFHLDNHEKTLFPIFTTRPDTIYGVTFMVIALNHPKLKELIKGTAYEETVQKFALDVKKAEEAEDTAFLEKNGVFTGVYAINPLNNERVPIYAGNFVVADYATGMIMAVPAHDHRDFEFAKKYDIPIKIVIQNKDKTLDVDKMTDAYTDEGTLVHSKHFDGESNKDAIENVSNYIERSSLGKKTVQYRIKDWLISRQRYWGTPIPMIHCPNCGIVPVPENELPLLLPDDVDFDVTGNPLLTSKHFVNRICPKCKGHAKRETDTMGGFMDSSWYFLRYCSPHTTDVPFDRNAVEYWMPVDQYVGGIEHAVGHLIYSRFFTKVLRDMKMLDVDEPFNALFNQGIVYKDGHKMSKSYGNIVTQVEIADKYGIDTARLFMLFVAAPDKEMEWSNQGLEGTHKFLTRVYRLFEDKTKSRSDVKDKNLLSKMHIIIRQITSEIENFKLNNAVVTLMDFVNYIYDIKEDVSEKVFNEALRNLSILLNPFAPHLSEECFELCGGEGFSSVNKWPVFDEGMIDDEVHFIEDIIKNTKKDIQSVITLSKIEKPTKITLIMADQWKYDMYSRVCMLSRNSPSKNISSISKELMMTDLKKHGQEIVRILPKIIDKLPTCVLFQDREFDAFISERVNFEEEFGCNVEIVKEAESSEQKARNASPGKPAIVVK